MSGPITVDINAVNDAVSRIAKDSDLITETVNNLKNDTASSLGATFTGATAAKFEELHSTWSSDATASSQSLADLSQWLQGVANKFVEADMNMAG